MFKVNDVVLYNDDKYRILHFDAESVIWIDIEKTTGMPSAIDMEEVLKAVNDGVLSRTEDPYEHLASIYPKQGSRAQVIRDNNYDLVRYITEDPGCFDPEIRFSLINEVAARTGSIKKTLYRYLRRYWQRGQTPNALLPDYKNSGARGKKRKANGKKLGRPRKHKAGVGAIVDEQVETLFRIAIDRYLLNDKGRSFAYAHRQLKNIYETYFPGTPEEEMPSKWQMLHFYKREYSQAETLKKKISSIEYNKDVRPLKSTANTDVLGPGSRYEIDATIADIYLVSDSDRGNIVGRPVIYMVIDVFSRMVAGLYIGFESPSYAAAVQALVVAMTDKVEWCKSHGIEIQSEEWPVVGLPDAILADRGELLGHQIESLESGFSVRIENAPPYRGDAKGIVERSFRTIQSEFKPFAPGVVGKTLVKKRGGRDYRLDAKLSVSDFKEIIIRSVLLRNQSHVLEKYDRDIDMPIDLEMTPLSLWNWGLQNRTGRLRAAPEEALRISMLPRTKATLSELGTCVFGAYYTCAELVESGWLHRSKEVRRPVSLPAAYDPASADTIYLFPKKNSPEYWICKLTDRSREFRGSSFWDVWQITYAQRKAVAASRLVSDKKKRHHEKFIEEKIQEAINKAPNMDHMSNAERIRDIEGNKAAQKAEERKTPLYRPEADKNKKPGKVIPLGEKQEEDYSFPTLIEELFDSEDN